MKLLKRNKKTEIYYALYQGEVDCVDEDGFMTGEKTVTYSEPKKMKVNASPSTGATSVEQFGTLTDYDKVLMTDDMNCPIDENSIIWLETQPSEEHNYKVKKIAKSLNSIAYAVKKVDVNSDLT